MSTRPLRLCRSCSAWHQFSSRLLNRRRLTRVPSTATSKGPSTWPSPPAQVRTVSHVPDRRLKVGCRQIAGFYAIVCIFIAGRIHFRSRWLFLRARPGPMVACQERETEPRRGRKLRRKTRPSFHFYLGYRERASEIERDINLFATTRLSSVRVRRSTFVSRRDL